MRRVEAAVRRRFEREIGRRVEDHDGDHGHDAGSGGAG